MDEALSSSRTRDRAVFLFILMAALAVRLWNLGGKSLWLDEVLSLDYASRPWLQILTNTAEDTPPLFYALAAAWKAILGSSEWALRFPSVLWGVLAVALTGWIGRLLDGRKLAWLSMGLMAFSPLAVNYSQMARMYALFLAATLASYGCLIQWKHSRRRRWAAAYIATTVVMAYSHNYWVFNFLAQQIFMAEEIVRRREPLMPWLRLSAGVVLGYAPWLTVLVRLSLHYQKEGFWIPPTGLPFLLSTVGGFVLWAGLPMALVWFYLALAAMGVTRRRTPAAVDPALPDQGGRVARLIEPGSTLLLLWFLCPLVIPFLWSKVAAPIFWDRYTYAAVPAFYLLVGRGVLSIPWRALRVAVIIALTVLALAGLHLYYPYQIEDWRGVARELEQRVSGNDQVILSPDYCRTSLAYYYRGHPVNTISETLRRGELRKALHPTIARGGHAWIVSWNLSWVRSPIPPLISRKLPCAVKIEERKFAGNIVLVGYDFSSCR